MTQSIELTAKRWKLLQMIGGLMTASGIVFIFLDIADQTWIARIGGVIFAAGLLLLVAGKAGAWWEDG